MSATIQILRIAAVIGLLGFAAAIATPKGRLPIAIRGLARTLGRPLAEAKGEKVPVWKRLLAFVLILLAVALTVI